MAITQVEFAALANGAYFDVRDAQANAPVLPSNAWFQLNRFQFGLGPTPGPGGFSAEVFRKGNDVVIAYQGTNPDPFAADGLKDWAGNLQLGFLGIATSQLRQAAELYKKVQAFFASENVEISFTGHSLGGGLAGLMSIYFNRPSVVFATAPFQPAASPEVAARIRDHLV